MIFTPTKHTLSFVRGIMVFSIFQPFLHEIVRSIIIFYKKKFIKIEPVVKNAQKIMSYVVHSVSKYSGYDNASSEEFNGMLFNPLIHIKESNL